MSTAQIGMAVLRDGLWLPSIRMLTRCPALSCLPARLTRPVPSRWQGLELGALEQHMQERLIGPDGDQTVCQHGSEPDLLPDAADPAVR